MPLGNGFSRRRPNSEAYLSEIAHSLQMQERHVLTTVCWSKAAAAIIEYAMAQEISVVVLATHGHSGLER
jgi:nucleotide-binding universal stress UspA family protein